MIRKLKILFISVEVHPVAKTGGLADVDGTLPSALNKLEHDIRVIMPKYTGKRLELSISRKNYRELWWNHSGSKPNKQRSYRPPLFTIANEARLL